MKEDGLPLLSNLIVFGSNCLKNSALSKTAGDGPLQLLWDAGQLGVAWSLKNHFVLLICCFGGDSMVIYLYTLSRLNVWALWWCCSATLVAKNDSSASRRSGAPYFSWTCEIGIPGRGQCASMWNPRCNKSMTNLDSWHGSWVVPLPADTTWLFWWGWVATERGC